MIKKLFLSLMVGIVALAVLLQLPPFTIGDSAVPSGVGAPEVLLEPLNTPVAGGANLVSIQPYLTAPDYADAERLHEKLRHYLLAAKQAGWLSPESLVVFPEHIGTWLVAEGESFLVYDAERAQTALLWSALGNLPDFVSHLWRETAGDPYAAALFKSKSITMAAHYQGIFSGLAKEFGVTLVAGSIVLPDPTVEQNQISVGMGALYNSSFLFYADGTFAGPVRKVYPIGSELPFVEPSRDALPVFDTPLGRLAILICADSWYPDTWRQVADAELVAVPSFSSPDGIWGQPWAGYNGAAAPADVDVQDVGVLSEGEAWRKYALGGRGGQLRAGLNTFLRGDLWDLGDDGRTTAILNGEVIQGERRDGAVVSSLWLN